eukprot:scaffold1634_cov95-Cylindrotheca_fusiformis.AAC.2
MPTLVEVNENKENSSSAGNRRHDDLAAAELRFFGNNLLDVQRQRRNKTNNHLLVQAEQQGLPHWGYFNMGLQSQLCNGSIKKCKKWGTGRKKMVSRWTVTSESYFRPEIDCIRCKNNLQGKEAANKNHHGHHSACPRKPENLRLLHLQRNVASMPSSNNMSPNKKRSNLWSTQQESKKRGKQRETDTTDLVGMHCHGYKLQKLCESSPMGSTSEFESDFVCDMKTELERAFQSRSQDWLDNHVGECEVMRIAAKALVRQFSIRRKTGDMYGTVLHTQDNQQILDKYYSFFPLQTCRFQFPMDTSNEPSPFYHVISGQTLIFLDWQMAFPYTRLPCPHCQPSSDPDAFLLRQHTNLGNDNSLFPIWTITGEIIWCVITKYKCKKCFKVTSANDGNLLHLLPLHMSEQYPVFPRYATSKSGNFHLHRNVTMPLEKFILTYANGEQLSQQLWQARGLQFTTKAGTYISRLKCCTSGFQGRPFLNSDTFIAQTKPPYGEKIRRLYQDAEYSRLQPFAYSNVERYTRELQQVTCREGDTLAFDHTFAALRTYRSTSAKAIATAINGRTKEVCFILNVPSTKLADSAHGVVQAVRKRKMKASVVTTDTIPNGISFWKTSFGSDVTCRLGLFHFVKRFSDQMDKHCELYWECHVELLDSIYKFNTEDWDKLVNVLMDGSYCTDGKKYSNNEIDVLRLNKQFTSRYSKWLRKEFHSKEEIISNLRNWCFRWENRSDDNGRMIFGERMGAVAAEQMNKVQYLLDAETSVPYEAKATSVKHGLTEWQSTRAESALEKVHEQLAHYGNVGLQEKSADAFILRGVAEHNVKARFKNACNNARFQDMTLAHPKYLDKTPAFMNHSLLHSLNEQYESVGMAKPFGNINVLPADNGERFVSDYVKDQEKRNQKGSLVGSEKECLCDECKPHYPQGMTATTTFQRARSVATQQQQEANGAPLATAPVRPVAQTVTACPALLPPPIHHDPVVFHPTMNEEMQLPVNNQYQIFFPTNPWPSNLARSFPNPTVCCSKYQDYTQQRSQGKTILGRPPHDGWCPRAAGYNH